MTEERKRQDSQEMQVRRMKEGDGEAVAALEARLDSLTPAQADLATEILTLVQKALPPADQPDALPDDARSSPAGG